MPKKTSILKPQPTLRGRNAWVVERMVEARGTSPAEVASWIIDHWIGQSREILLDLYDIDVMDFQKRQKVVLHPSSSTSPTSDRGG